jgi:hypothetical protein
MIPMLAALVNALLPPLLQVLGLVMRLLGKLVEVIGNLIMNFVKLPIKLGLEFEWIAERIKPGKGEREEEVEAIAKAQGISLRDAWKQVRDKEVQEGFESFQQTKAGEVVGKISEFVTQFGGTLVNVGEEMDRLAAYFREHPPLKEKTVKELQGSILGAADRISTFRFPARTEAEVTEIETPTGAAGATPAVYESTGAGYTKLENAQLSEADAARKTSENTEAMAEGTNALLEEQKKENTIMQTLLTEIRGLNTAVNSLTAKIGR